MNYTTSELSFDNRNSALRSGECSGAEHGCAGIKSVVPLTQNGQTRKERFSMFDYKTAFYAQTTKRTTKIKQ